ncbi:MAG: hypothetical protein DLM58_08635 [Pseudonocardiales bacterium]|nr:MAG: hypothetical protein DLM58_08635 [Pseudonocardiales bacterium]
MQLLHAPPDSTPIWLFGFGFVGFWLLFALVLWLGARYGRGRRLRIRDERRHGEQLEWRASGRLPVRYETTYWPDEPVDEDMARMEELGYYVADDIMYANGSRHVVYRLGGASVL